MTLRVHASLVRPIGKSEILIISVTPHSYRIRRCLSPRVPSGHAYKYMYINIYIDAGEEKDILRSDFFLFDDYGWKIKKSFITMFNVIGLCINNKKKKKTLIPLQGDVFFFTVLNLQFLFTVDQLLKSLIQLYSLLYKYLVHGHEVSFSFTPGRALAIYI